MQIHRILLVRDTAIAVSRGLADRPVMRVAACAVIRNPLAASRTDDLAPLVDLGAQLGGLLAGEALGLLANPVVAYGKAAIVGADGDIEHGAALLHPRMGKPIRDAIGGGQALIPSNVKIGGPGCVVDVPLGHKDDAWSFDEIDTMSVMVPDGPRRDEIVVAVVVSDGGRPRPRVRPVRIAA
ncbi:MAG: amino acid synthesis family protein [Burkholderiales bacterium]|nr:amino acid synthesis family protein [Burkholderiales bacterium]OJX00828.1 MAG: peptide synthetase [Burkholderiales bacterium 70-64]